MKKLVHISCILLWQFGFSQYQEIISSDRPGQAIGSLTVGKNIFQIQTGYNFNSINGNFLNEDISNLSTVFRFGILEHLEINSQINWQSIQTTSNKINGISDTQIGTRFNFQTQKDWFPNIGVQGRLLLKIQDDVFKRNSTGGQIILVTENTLSNSLTLVSNLGVTWNGNSQGATSLYVLNLGYSISDTLGTFIELYGSFKGFSTYFDTGLSYLIHKNLMLDISTGWQGENDTSDWFIDFGFSYRFDWSK